MVIYEKTINEYAKSDESELSMKPKKDEYKKNNLTQAQEEATTLTHELEHATVVSSPKNRT